MKLNPLARPGSPTLPFWKLTKVPTALLLGSLVVGCGDGRPTRVPVSGVVMVDGEPVPSGQVMFVPEGTRPSSSKIDSEGRFNLECFDGGDGAVLGTHRVQVFACEYTQKGANWYAPKKYADFRSSGLTHEVTETDDSVVIELTWEGEKRPKKKR